MVAARDGTSVLIIEGGGRRTLKYFLKSSQGATVKRIIEASNQLLIDKSFSRPDSGIENLRPYDLRGTFATRLVERGVHQYVISALMGHAMPEEGFGHESRITPGYAQATWESMIRAVESLEYPASEIILFGRQSGKNQEKSDENDVSQEKVKAG